MSSACPNDVRERKADRNRWPTGRRWLVSTAGGTPVMRAREPVDEAVVDQAEMRACIEEQRCPWCNRRGLRSLANHTVLVHGVYAEELREMAGLARDAPLCSPELSECHRELARDRETTQWLHRPDVLLAGAATREANYDDEQRQRRSQHLLAVRRDGIEAARRRLQAEKEDPNLAAARRITRSQARRAFRPGTECPICGVWFCSYVPVGKDYKQRKYCSAACRGEAIRRHRARTWFRRHLNADA